MYKDIILKLDYHRKHIINAFIKRGYFLGIKLFTSNKIIFFKQCYSCIYLLKLIIDLFWFREITSFNKWI